MSPSWRETLRIGLGRDRLVFARWGRGLRPRLLDKGILPVEPRSAGEPWRAVLAAMEKLLPGAAPRAADASVVLSSHFVRHRLLEANAALGSEDEWSAYAAHQFEKTYGAPARDWEIRVAQAGAAQPRLACAIDKALLEALKAAFAKGSARLGSVQPYLMAAFNGALPEMRDPSFWFVLQEPGRVLLGLLREGAWTSVRSRGAGARWSEELPQILEREGALLGCEPCASVLLSSFDSFESGARDGYRFTALPAPFPGEDPAYAMVGA